LTRSTLADANAQRPWQVFSGLFAHLVGQLTRGLKRKTGEAVHLIDSSSLRLSALSKDWARFSAGVCGAKMHIVYDPDATWEAECFSDEPRDYGVIAFQDGPGYRALGWEVGNTQLRYKDAMNAIEASSPGTKAQFFLGYLERGAPLFKTSDTAELTSCESCGQPTTGRFCAFCRARAQILYWAFLGFALSEKPLPPATYKRRLGGLKGLSHVTVEVELCPHHSPAAQH
jgi:hypothetical protein